MGGRAAWTGRVDHGELGRLVDEGLTVRAIANRLDVSYSTVRHWLRRYGLQTARGLRLAQTKVARDTGASSVIAVCDRHGSTQLVPRPGGGFRCLRCRNEAVTARRRRLKELLVAEAGGACRLCGYDRSVAALHFHHVDPAAKEFTIAGAGMTRSLARARIEAAKCVLLCANCHAEVESATGPVPFATGPDPSGHHPG